LLGCLIGWMIQEGFIIILVDLFDVATFPSISFRPFAIGAVTALVCLFAFAVPPLVSLQGISPLRVLRRDIGANTVSDALSFTIGVAGIGLLMFWYSESAILTLTVLSGVGLTFLIVGCLAWYLLRGGSLVGMQAGSAWRLALASMRRRGMQNAVQAVIFSLSIMLLLMLALVRSSLIEEWQIQLPEGTPNHFLVNVAESEVTAVDRLLTSNQLAKEHIYPMVRGRLTEINRTSINARLIASSEDTRSDMDREINLSWSEKLPSNNVVLAGQWWDKDSSKAEISIESGLAERLQVNLNDSLTFQIGSEKLSVTVTSIRQLDWDSMRPNFYMMFPPGLLKQFPATYITSFYLPSDKKLFLNQFLREFPTITVIEMDSMIVQIRSIISQVSQAIELVLALIIVSGLLVLVASVQASLDSRFQESAILRTLGAGRKLVLGSLVIEFSSLGLLAGFLAAVSAELSVFGLQEFLLDMEFVMHPWVWIAGPVIGAILIGSAGYITCRKVVNTPPVEVLREL
jgi:putative ABC transport system permease protein